MCYWKRVKRIVIVGLDATDDSLNRMAGISLMQKAPFTHDLGLVTWESESGWHWP